MPRPEMTGRQRILAAVRHEEPDRVPVSPRVWAYLLWRYGDSSLATELAKLPEMDPMYVVSDGTPDWLSQWPEQYDIPQVKVDQTRRRQGDAIVIERTFRTPAGDLTDSSRLYPPGGTYGIKPAPIKTEFPVKCREDLEPLKYLLPKVNSNFEDLRRHVELVGERGVSMVYVYGAVSLVATGARSIEDLMIDYYKDRPFFDDLIGLYHRRSLERTKAALEAGAEFIFGAWFWNGMSSGWSPTTFRQVFLPQIREHVALVHGYDAWYDYYDDGKLADTMEMIADAGVDVLETCTPPPVGDFDLRLAKEKIGGKTTIKGYVDLLYVMRLGTAADVRRTVREAMEIAKPGGGFIIGSSDSFRDGTPEENIRAYFESCRAHGVYG